MNRSYDPSAIEPKWQEKWAAAKVYDFDLRKAKDPFYLLVMFPYPSGARLHVGHWFQYSIPDSYGRFLRMKNRDVFHPMGFDAFGLPAENYAIKSGVPPAASTEENVETMIAQFKRMGVMFDWKHRLDTSKPDYYRWTQWLFLQMFAHGLAYKKEAPVNFCPSCKTVLANEQAQDGRCERCGTEVVQKPLNQWFWKITKYAQRLLDGHDSLDWPEKTKTMQRNWIGRSEGTEVRFAVAPSEHHAAWEAGEELTITVFTTRVDTLFGCTYLVLAPEHPLVERITAKDHWGAVQSYREAAKKKTELERTALEKEKTGVPAGAFALHPLTGERLPVWVADFVIGHYGSGAVFADAHDERDFAFAKKYGIPLKATVRPADGSDDSAIRNLETCFTGDGILFDSGEFSGLHSAEARKKIAARLEDEEKGRLVVQYRLRDWLVSRQRYWGAPIPIVYDPSGLPHPIPEKHLPWLLPTDVEFHPTGESPLKHSKEFKERTEKLFGKGWEPEYDTMDTFVCSSFYELRFLMEGNAKHFVDPSIEKKWMSVDMYIGGPEHACMHLIYARFVMMALHDFGFVSNEEPFQKLVHQGLITNKGAKMSKSHGNVVSPDAFVERHGSDVFRMYLMFMGPFTDGGDWSDTGIKGIDRFVQRVWRMLSSISPEAKDDPSMAVLVHRTVKRVTESLEKLHFNTAISALMEFLNAAESSTGMSRGTAKVFARLLAPLAPHLAEELWEALHAGEKRAAQGKTGFVIDEEWPDYDPALIKDATVTIAVQVNGKLRGQVTVNADAPEAEVLALARAEENVKKHLGEKKIKKEIHVKGRLVNFVVA